MSSLVTLHQDTVAAPGPGLGAGTPAAGDFLTVPRTRSGEREEVFYIPLSRECVVLGFV